jgi:hypothetical protein
MITGRQQIAAERQQTQAGRQLTADRQQTQAGKQQTAAPVLLLSPARSFSQLSQGSEYESNLYYADPNLADLQQCLARHGGYSDCKDNLAVMTRIGDCGDNAAVMAKIGVPVMINGVDESILERGNGVANSDCGEVEVVDEAMVNEKDVAVEVEESDAGQQEEKEDEESEGILLTRTHKHTHTHNHTQTHMHTLTGRVGPSLEADEHLAECEHQTQSKQQTGHQTESRQQIEEENEGQIRPFLEGDEHLNAPSSQSSSSSLVVPASPLNTHTPRVDFGSPSTGEKSNSLSPGGTPLPKRARFHGRAGDDESPHSPPTPPTSRTLASIQASQGSRGSF